MSLTPLTRFLGVPDDASPFELLGLRPDRVGLEQVVQALEHRLARIAVHAESRTPAADEVRLALHAAAAQLLDPRTRDQLVAAAPAPRALAVDAPARHTRDDEPLADEFAAPPDEHAVARFSLRADAILVLAMNGGWNQRALRDLCIYAHARGLTADDAANALSELASGQVQVQRTAPAAERLPAVREPHTPRPASELAAAPPVAPEPELSHADPLVKLLIIGVGVSFVLVVMVLGVLLLSGGTPANTAAPIASDATVTKDTPSELFPADRRPPITPVAKPAPVALSEAQSITREITSCSAGLTSDPQQAASRFAAAVDALSRRWPDWPKDELTAAHSAIIQYVYDASVTRVAAQAGDALTAAAAPAAQPLWSRTPSDVTRVVWGVGILARLVQERGLPAGLIESFRRAYAASAPDASTISEPTFEGGVALALPILAEALVPPTETTDERLTSLPALWSAWRHAAESALGSSTPRTTRLELVALEQLLTRAPDATASRAVAETVQAAVIALSWREPDESRRWLLRWFDAPTIRTPQLHVVTATLAGKSGAAGVSVGMVLSAGADARERALLRGQYAKAWNLDAAQDKGQASQRLIAVATQELSSPTLAQAPADPARKDDAPPDPLPPVGELVKAVTLSRLSEAAQLLWLGHADAAAALAEHPDETARAALTKAAGSGAASPTPFSADSPWAAKYLGLGANGTARAEMLRQMAASSSLGPVDLEIVASEALRSGSPQVRAAARDIIKHRASEPAVVNALLELLPTAGITPDNAELFSAAADARTPNLRDPLWRAKVRRALVERLLQLVAGSSDFAGTDALSDALAASFAVRCGDVTPSDAPSDAPAAPNPPLERSARTLRERLENQAQAMVPTGKELLPLAEIRRRGQARLEVAAGLIQRFAAEQVTAADVFAYILVCEDPTRAAAVSEIMTALTRQRRQATHVLVQIHAAEEATLKLWLLRLGATPAGGAP